MAEPLLTLTPRAAEYLSVRELQAQTGQEAENFAAVVVKELVDNAIDACEVAGVDPVIGIAVDEHEDHLYITVADNGPGIPAKTIEGVLDFAVRASTNFAWKAPTRGMQGNALKTILGIPFALGSDHPVIIETAGRRHAIRLMLDPANHVRIEHTIEHADTTGTSITVVLPDDQLFNPVQWAQAFSLFNPHATVKISVSLNGIYQAESIFEKTADFTNGYRKHVPDDLTSPYWYTAGDMQRLVFAYINAGRDLTLREFVRQFRGLTGTGKQKMVAEMLPSISKLSDFENDPDRVALLHRAMQEAATPPKPAVLGCVGADHFQRCFGRHGLHDGRFWHKKVEGMAAGMPFVVEAALGEAEVNGMFFGVNFSSSFDDPLPDTRLEGPKFFSYGVRGFLNHAHCDPHGDEQHRRLVFAIHITSPSFEFLDRGKTKLANLPSSMVEAISTVMWSVCKTIYAEEERRRRDAAREEKRREAALPKRDEISIKDAVFAVLPAAVTHATGDGQYPTNARNLFYATRKLAQEYTDKGLDYTYFAQTLLVEYQRKYGPIQGLYYDPRGVLYEPHTGKTIAVGTREVDSYDFPSWTYDKILYVEKKGMWPIIQAAKIAERYDMAVLAAEGYATEAARMLFQRAEKSGNCRLFVLHDADPDGLNIARTLREETRRVQDYSVDVVDIGLHLEDAVEMGLQYETFTRKKALPTGLVLTDKEREYFQGRQVNRKQWIGKRFELNALTAPQLIGYIENQLEEHGATGKVVPPEDVLKKDFGDRHRRELRQAIEDELMARLDIDSMVQRVMGQIPAPAFDPTAITDMLTATPTISWRDAINRVVRDHVNQALESDECKAAIKTTLTVGGGRGEVERNFEYE